MADAPAPTGNSGAALPAGQADAGSSPPAGGRSNSGTGEAEPTVDRNAVWNDAKKHFEPEIKKFKTQAEELAKRLAKYEHQAKTAEQLEAELTQTRSTLERQHGIVKGFAESRLEALPEHLRDILSASAGEDPLKALELLPKFEDLARKTQLKTVGGAQQANSGPQIDFAKLQLEAACGNTAQLRDTFKTLGQGDIRKGEEKYNALLQEWFARGKR